MTATPEEMQAVVLTSLRQTLDAKLAQHQGVDPLVIVMRTGNHRLRPEMITDLVVRRVWPNTRYTRIASIGIYEPWIPQKAGGRPPRISFFHNPEAKPAAPYGFISATSGTH